MDKETGLIEEGQLNTVKHVHTKRPDGSLRIQTDYQFCPTMAEQHTAHLSDINYLMKKYKPDELAAYIAARKSYRQEILGHDFTQEPNLQTAKNFAYQLKKLYDNLPSQIKSHFSNHVEFLKFIDNPANQEKMIKLGLMTPQEIQQHTAEPPPINNDTNDEQTQEQPQPQQTTKTKTKK